MAAAATPDEYVTTLRRAGFIDFVLEDQGQALTDLVNDLRKNLLGVGLAVGLGKLDLGDLDLEEGKQLARRAVVLIESGTVGYTLITATLPGS